MSQERVKELLELATQELELIKYYGTEKEKAFIISRIRSQELKKYNEIPFWLKKDEDVFRELLSSNTWCTDLNQQIFDVFGIELYMELLENNFDIILRYLNYCPNFRDDIRVAKIILGRNIQYHYCFPKLHSDIEFTVKLIKFNPELYHKSSLKNNRILMTEYLFASSDISIDLLPIFKSKLISGKKKN